jgi:cytochrome P450
LTAICLPRFEYSSSQFLRFGFLGAATTMSYSVGISRRIVGRPIQEGDVAVAAIAAANCDPAAFAGSDALGMIRWDNSRFFFAAERRTGFGAQISTSRAQLALRTALQPLLALTRESD